MAHFSAQSCRETVRQREKTPREQTQQKKIVHINLIPGIVQGALFRLREVNARYKNLPRIACISF